MTEQTKNDISHQQVNQQQAIQQQVPPIDNPFLTMLGVQFLENGDGKAHIALDLAEQHMNSWQITHGGVLMTLLDVVMAMAGRSLHPDQKGVVTVEMKTSFLQPGGVPGGRLDAYGKAFFQSSTMCFCEAEIRHGERLIAKAMGTFKYLKQLRTGERMRKICGSD